MASAYSWAFSGAFRGRCRGFSGAFAAPFAGRRRSAGFSGAFAAPFAGRGLGCGFVAPIMAKAAIAGGAAWEVSGNGLVIGGRVLIGQAGKVFEFRCRATAEKWAASAVRVSASERSVGARVSEGVAAAYVAKKRENLSVIAQHVALAAARQVDLGKRAALMAEAEYCLSKWG